MSSKTQNLKLFQPIDRVAQTLILMLSLLIGLLLWGGDRYQSFSAAASGKENTRIPHLCATSRTTVTRLPPLLVAVTAFWEKFIADI